MEKSKSGLPRNLNILAEHIIEGEPYLALPVIEHDKGEWVMCCRVFLVKEETDERVLVKDMA